MYLLISIVIFQTCLLKCYQAQDKSFVAVHHTKQFFNVMDKFAKIIAPKLCDKDNTKEKLDKWIVCLDEHTAKKNALMNQQVIEVKIYCLIVFVA